MGIYDRDYTHDNYDRGGPGMRLMLPRITPAVKWLLITNVAVFVPAYMIPALDEFLTMWFSVYPDKATVRNLKRHPMHVLFRFVPASALTTLVLG